MIKKLDKGIVSNPEVAFGRACIEGTGIAIEVVVQRYNAGETKEELADDYGLTVGQILSAINFGAGNTAEQILEVFSPIDGDEAKIVDKYLR